MAINDIVQTIAEARVDARSLSEFVFKPAGFKVARRLAPPVDTLQFYINRFNSLDGNFSSSVSVALSSLNNSVAEADSKVAYIETTVQDAINNTAVEGGILADTFVTKTVNGVGQIARTQRDKNSDLVSVLDYGAVGDGVTDDTEAIKLSLEHLNYAYLPSGMTYLLSDTVNVPDGGSIFSDYSRATIKTNYIDKHTLVILRHGSVSNLNIELKTGYTEGLDSIYAAIYVPLGTAYNANKAYAHNIDILGSNWGVGSAPQNAVGVYFGGDGQGSVVGISYSVFDNIRITRAKVGIYTKGTNNGYVTSNSFINIKINGSLHGFYIYNGGANKFLGFDYNHNDFADYPIYCGGQHNEFNGFFYDMHNGENPNVLACFFDSAIHNYLDTTAKGGIIIDESLTGYNDYQVKAERTSEIIHKQLSLPYDVMTLPEVYALGKDRGASKPYMGVQDNILAFADRIHKVTFNGVEESIANKLRIFNPFRVNGLYQTYHEPLTIEIELDNYQIGLNGLDFIQVSFATGFIATDVKIEISSATTSTDWITVLDISENKLKNVGVKGNSFNGLAEKRNIRRIKLTMHSTDSETSFRPYLMEARCLARPGHAFLPKNGGIIVGDLDFQSADLGVSMVSPDGSRWKLSVDDTGNISANSVD